jgi:hypothetical protein
MKYPQTKIEHATSDAIVREKPGDMQFDVGTVLRSTKGWPFKVTETSRDYFKTDFGKPIEGDESAHQAYFALNTVANTIGKFVRVVNILDAMYQTLEFSKAGLADKGAWADGATYVVGDVVLYIDDRYYIANGDHTASATNAPDGASPVWDAYPTENAYAYDTEVVASNDVGMIFYPKNGSDGDGLSLEIANLDATTSRFEIVLKQDQTNGTTKEIERHVVSLSEGATYGGFPAYLPSVLERKLSILGVSLNSAMTFDQVFVCAGVAFSGGTSGTAPASSDYEAAWALLAATSVDLDQIFTAGEDEETIIAKAAAIAKDRVIRIEIDGPIGGVTDFETFANGMGLLGESYCFTHGQVRVNDPFIAGQKVTLRLSGFVTACKAFGRNKSRTLTDPGVWEAPAGEDFGMIRGATGIENMTVLSSDDETDLSGLGACYPKNGTQKGVVIWEQYTQYGEDNPLAYKDNVDVMHYLYHAQRQIVQGVQFRKKKDDAVIEALSKPVARISSKCLLPAEDPEDPNPAPYKVEIVRVGSLRQVNTYLRFNPAWGYVLINTVTL